MALRSIKSCVALAGLAALGACSVIPKSAPASAVAAAAPSSAIAAGLAAGPALGSLALGEEDAAGALASFVESCPHATSREDASGLTAPGDWRAACEAARGWPAGAAARFFTSYFTPVRVGEGEAFATGYFEPEIAGCRTRRPGCEVPVYAVPDDLVRAWPADTPPDERDGRPPLGRYDESGDFVPYFERSEIEEGALDGRGLAFAFAEDPVEMFFLQIQGSGRLRTREGEIIRIGYAGQNGREYVGIGRVMRERGMIGDGTAYPTSMQGIMAYLREHPEKGRAVMRLNKSWIFFRELTGDGPLGSIGVPVRRGQSVAVDPRFVPYGAPVWLDLERDEADGLWIAQDTGGAIKGANRFDTFWGAGEDARAIAGGMSAKGEALILLPRESAARLLSR